MKTIDQLRDELKTKTAAAMGFDLNDYDQGSEQWHLSRLGVITASRSEVVYKPGRKKGTYSDQRQSYMYELIAEIITGESKEVSGKALSWGTDNEEGARVKYGDCDQIPFIYTDNMRCGYSPDGLTESGLIEIKCPYASENHLKTVFEQHIKPEYIAQMQFGMWVSGRDHCDFVSYDPRIKRTTDLCVIRVDKDEETQKTLDIEIPKFIAEMDELLKSLGLEFGQQWDIEI